MINKRIDMFNKLCDEHPYYKNHKSIQKELKRKAGNGRTIREEAVHQIEICGEVSAKDFRTKVAYLYLDMENKPRKWDLIQELIITVAGQENRVMKKK